MSDLPMMLQGLKQATVQYTCPEVEVVSFGQAADFLELSGYHWPHCERVLRLFHQELAGQVPHNEWIGWGSVGPTRKLHGFYREAHSLCGRLGLADVGRRLTLDVPADTPRWRWCARCLEVLRRSKQLFSLLRRPEPQLPLHPSPRPRIDLDAADLASLEQGGVSGLPEVD